MVPVPGRMCRAECSDRETIRSRGAGCTHIRNTHVRAQGRCSGAMACTQCTLPMLKQADLPCRPAAMARAAAHVQRVTGAGIAGRQARCQCRRGRSWQPPHRRPQSRHSQRLDLDVSRRAPPVGSAAACVRRPCCQRLRQLDYSSRKASRRLCPPPAVLPPAGGVIPSSWRRPSAARAPTLEQLRAHFVSFCN